MRWVPAPVRWVASVLLLGTLLAPHAVAAPPSPDRGVTPDREVTLPPVDAPWDYQIGGARPVPDGVRVVVRDREDEPAGEYPVCYVNAFQTQPHEAAYWRHRKRRGLLLRDRRGRPVVDEGWGEWLLDTRAARKRKKLARIVGRWMRGCARDGFAAVELDNLDSWTRSGRRLRRRHNLAYARLLTDAGHEAGLAVAQKNTVEVARRGRRIGFDLAVVEDCARWRECEEYADAYGDRAYLVEYRVRDWRRACRTVGDRVSVTLRDRMVRPGGPFRTC